MIHYLPQPFSYTHIIVWCILASILVLVTLTIKHLDKEEKIIDTSGVIMTIGLGSAFLILWPFLIIVVCVGLILTLVYFLFDYIAKQIAVKIRLLIILFERIKK